MYLWVDFHVKLMTSRNRENRQEKVCPIFDQDSDGDAMML